jgi:hypothetical protein
MTDALNAGRIEKVRPIPLPSTVEDLVAARKIAQVKTLNDYVDEVHEALWNDEEYRRLLESVYNEDAVEGSLIADDLLAAQMIREYARAKGITYLKDRKLATIVKSLNVVLRRYDFDRKARANTVSGHSVQAD